MIHYLIFFQEINRPRIENDILNNSSTSHFITSCCFIFCVCYNVMIFSDLSSITSYQDLKTALQRVICVML